MDFPPEGSVLGLWSREEHRSSRSGELVCRKCRQKYDPRYKSEFKDWEFLRQFSGWEVDYITLGWYIYIIMMIYSCNIYICIHMILYVFMNIIYIWDIYYIYIRNYGKDVSPHPMGSLMDHLHFLVKVVEPTFWDIHVLPKMDISIWEKSVVYGLENKVVTVGWASNTIWKLLSKLHHNIWVGCCWVCIAANWPLPLEPPGPI